jgi:hypothetical protein
MFNFSLKIFMSKKIMFLYILSIYVSKLTIYSSEKWKTYPTRKSHFSPYKNQEKNFIQLVKSTDSERESENLSYSSEASSFKEDSLEYIVEQKSQQNIHKNEKKRKIETKKLDDSSENNQEIFDEFNFNFQQIRDIMEISGNHNKNFSFEQIKFFIKDIQNFLNENRKIKYLKKILENIKNNTNNIEILMNDDENICSILKMRFENNESCNTLSKYLISKFDLISRIAESKNFKHHLKLLVSHKKYRNQTLKRIKPEYAQFEDMNQFQENNSFIEKNQENGKNQEILLKQLDEVLDRKNKEIKEINDQITKEINDIKLNIDPIERINNIKEIINKNRKIISKKYEKEIHEILTKHMNF